jgi:hypothetical protein
MLREDIVDGDVARWGFSELLSGELLYNFVWWDVMVVLARREGKGNTGDLDLSAPGRNLPQVRPY